MLPLSLYGRRSVRIQAWSLLQQQLKAKTTAYPALLGQLDSFYVEKTITAGHLGVTLQQYLLFIAGKNRYSNRSQNLRSTRTQSLVVKPKYTESSHCLSMGGVGYLASPATRWSQ